MSRVLVTGGAGFLGSWIADELTAQGHETVVFDIEPSEHLQSNQEMIVGDLLDPESLARATQGVDAVYHLAAAADINTAGRDAVSTANANVLGTIHALEAAVKHEVTRFVFASTVYVYSRSGGFYRCSKQAAESYVEEFHRQQGLDYTVLRYGSLYGPRADDSNGVHRLLRTALEDGSILHAGTPDDTREYIHVADAARLSVEALGLEFANQHLTLTGTHPTRIRDLFTMFSEIIGREVDIEYSEADGDHYSLTPYAYTPRTGRKMTSTSHIDLGQGLLELVEAFHQATPSNS